MPEFLAETYAPRSALDIVPLGAGEAALAADQVSQPGAPVRLLGAIAVPQQQTCLYLDQAPPAGAVRAAMTRARRRPGRITPAVPVQPRPGPAPNTGPP